MADRLILEAPHGTLAGYGEGCRCAWCQPAGKYIAADGTPPGRAPQPRERFRWTPVGHPSVP